MKKLFLISPIALMLACGGETETETTTTPEEQVPVLSEDEQIENYLTEKGWTGVRHESGMYVVTDTLGTGDERPSLTDDVTIFYKGFLLDGSQFDGTTDTPATFPLSNLIEGWQIGIPMFGKGGKGKLVIPPMLAYGPEDVTNPDGSVAIPGNSILMFEIEVVDWAPSAGMGM